VTVEATSPKLVGKAATVTDATGTFRLMALPSGTYQLTFSLPGFKTLIRKDIILQLSQTLVVNVTMEPAAIEEQVTVVGQSPLIDVKSTVKGQVMTKETFMNLPRGRSFDSLIGIMPGVQSEGITGGLSVDGATGTENMWYVDGADVTNVHIGTSGQNVVLELVDEVKVTASGYNAEFGGSMGGVVNVISNAPADAAAIVERLIANPAVRRVNFTGSTHVGRIVGELSARHLKPALLELGGKAPLLVLDDADLDAAVAAAAFGAYFNQGQICMSTERLIVDAKVADAFIAKLTAKVASLRAR